MFTPVKMGQSDADIPFEANCLDLAEGRAQLSEIRRCYSRNLHVFVSKNNGTVIYTNVVSHILSLFVVYISISRAN